MCQHDGEARPPQLGRGVQDRPSDIRSHLAGHPGLGKGCIDLVERWQRVATSRGIRLASSSCRPGDVRDLGAQDLLREVQTADLAGAPPIFEKPLGQVFEPATIMETQPEIQIFAMLIGASVATYGKHKVSPHHHRWMAEERTA